MYDCSEIKFLLPEEKEALFDVIAEDTSKYRIRNRSFFLLAEYAALRASEVGLMRVCDVNFTRKEIYFRRLKGSRNNTLRIMEESVWNALLDYMDFRKQHDIYSELLYPSQKGNPISRKTLHKLMKKYCAAAQIPKEKSHFHVLKHTRAVHLAELGLDTKEIQYWTGHKNIANTEVYLQFTTTQQETLYKKIFMLQNVQNKC